MNGSLGVCKIESRSVIGSYSNRRANNKLSNMMMMGGMMTAVETISAGRIRRRKTGEQSQQLCSLIAIQIKFNFLRSIRNINSAVGLKCDIENGNHCVVKITLARIKKLKHATNRNIQVRFTVTYLIIVIPDHITHLDRKRDNAPQTPAPVLLSACSPTIPVDTGLAKPR
ncbi:hypothetical protein J6590_011538 [Homalodisca vitripennis]|nr:hypothetical protein J6590_011538 [Homalodisca vitripennis]